MTQEVILMAHVSGLGGEGDVVKVSEGYARNFLMPKKLAAPVTGATRRRIEAQRQQRDEQAELIKTGAADIAKKLEQASVSIPVKVGPEGKMYGSVSTADIAAGLNEQGFKVDKRNIQLSDPIKELGVFKVPVKLHDDVAATLKVWVVEE